MPRSTRRHSNGRSASASPAAAVSAASRSPQPDSCASNCAPRLFGCSARAGAAAASGTEGAALAIARNVSMSCARFCGSSSISSACCASARVGPLGGAVWADAAFGPSSSARYSRIANALIIAEISPPDATACRRECSTLMHDASVIIETDVPARLDRLPWTRFHSLVIVALGITWILDGLEVTIAGSIVGALQESPVLHFTAEQIGLVGPAYLAGAVVGALLFGYLTDR